MKEYPLSRNYKLVIAYDGTAYGGWQIQPNALTIQEVIQNGIQILLREKIAIIGSGRTDAGVHARAQVAHFRYAEEINPRRFVYSLNALLPHDIRIKSIEEVPLSFHAQYSVKEKSYRYFFCLDSVEDPFRRLYALHSHEKIDFSLLKENLPLLLGKQDFTSFANEGQSGSAAINPVRILTQAELKWENEHFCYLEFTANGFLYKMVRNMVGTLLEIGSGKRPSGDVSRILKSKDRKQAGQAAPAHPLFLWNVAYEKSTHEKD